MQAQSAHVQWLSSARAPAGSSYATSEAELALVVSRALLRLHKAHRKPLPVTLILHSQPGPSAAKDALGAGKLIL